MRIHKKHQTSLFLLAASVSGGAAACSVGFYDDGTTCVPAQVGTYVPVAGATAATQAPVGSYVNAPGASAATLAPAGTYAPDMGMSTSYLAPVGYYVPTSGSGSATAVSPGFYTSTTGSVNQIPAGGITAPLSAGLQASALLADLSAQMLESTQSSALKVNFAYQRSNVDQVGLSSGRLTNNLYGVLIQADVIKNAGGNSGIQLAYAHHNLKNGSEVSDTGNTYQFGVFHSGPLAAGEYQGALVYGQSTNDLRRNVTATRYELGSEVTNNEVLTSQPKVSWYGVQSVLKYPVLSHMYVSAQLGVLSFKAKAINESGVATAGGSSVPSLTALGVASHSHVSIPALFGVNYALVSKEGSTVAPVIVTVGAVGDFAGKQTLQVTTGGSFDMPVKQSSEFSGLLRLKVNAWELSRNTELSGLIQGQWGSGVYGYQASLNFVQKW